MHYSIVRSGGVSSFLTPERLSPSWAIPTSNGAVTASTPFTANVPCAPHQAPASLAASGRSHAATEIVAPVHAHATCFTDLRYHAISADVVAWVLLHTPTL